MKIIDTKMHGRDGITGTFLVQGEKTALVEAGPRSSLKQVLAGLAEAGVETLDWIVVTHIHLDHAGAAGALAMHFPEATVAVHEVGAPHLIDPEKLWSSAARIYGDEMDRMWGGIDPITPNRIRALTDGDKIDLGGRALHAVETPGHARHHHAFLDDDTGTVFTGDAMGVRLSDIGVMRPATPPPEFNLEDAIASIRRIGQLGASRLCLTHFGLTNKGPHGQSVDEVCEEAIEALSKWAEWVRDGRTRSSEVDAVAEDVKRAALEDLQGKVSESDIERMEQTTSFWMNTWGYMRYFDKLEKTT